MNRLITSTAIPARELKIEALASMSASFERLCLAAGLEALGEMMEVDAQTACGPRHGRGKDRTAHRWGKTKGKIGFHGGKVEIARPRLRSFDGKEQALSNWEGPAPCRRSYEAADARSPPCRRGNRSCPSSCPSDAPSDPCHAHGEDRTPFAHRPPSSRQAPQAQPPGKASRSSPTCSPALRSSTLSRESQWM